MKLSTFSNNINYMLIKIWDLPTGIWMRFLGTENSQNVLCFTCHHACNLSISDLNISCLQFKYIFTVIWALKRYDKGGLLSMYCVPPPPSYNKVKIFHNWVISIHLMVHLFHAGFLKYGFDQRGGRSLVDILHQIYFNTGGRVSFLLLKPTSPYVDRQLQEVGTIDGTGVLPWGPRARHLARSTNTSGINVKYIPS